MRNAAFQQLFSMAKEDPRLLLLVSDVSADIVKDFTRELPRQIFMEGIAEGHLVGMAAGLARKNHVVFINTIASFLSKRAFEQVAINLCLESANVKLLAQGGGLVYGQQGSTHHALEDIALMRSLPGMKLIVPCDTHQTRQAVRLAASTPGPVYIRLGKGQGPVVSGNQNLDLHGGNLYQKPGQNGVLIVTTGILTPACLEAARKIPGCGVLGVPVVKPFPETMLSEQIKNCRLVVVAEEHSAIGGLAEAVAGVMVRENQSRPAFLGLSLPDAFVRTYGKQEELLALHGLDAGGILKSVTQALKDTEKNT